MYIQETNRNTIRKLLCGYALVCMVSLALVVPGKRETMQRVRCVGFLLSILGKGPRVFVLFGQIFQLLVIFSIKIDPKNFRARGLLFFSSISKLFSRVLDLVLFINFSIFSRVLHIRGFNPNTPMVQSAPQAAKNSILDVENGQNPVIEVNIQTPQSS